MAADIPNVQFINFVQTPLTLTFGATGIATAMLTTANPPVVDITGFRKVNILGPYGQAFGCRLLMGEIAPATMAEQLDVPLDGKIHTFEVKGPQMMLEFVNGPANATKQIQLMIYLRS